MLYTFARQSKIANKCLSSVAVSQQCHDPFGTQSPYITNHNTSASVIHDTEYFLSKILGFVSSVCQPIMKANRRQILNGPNNPFLETWKVNANKTHMANVSCPVHKAPITTGSGRESDVCNPTLASRELFLQHKPMTLRL